MGMFNVREIYQKMKKWFGLGTVLGYAWGTFYLALFLVLPSLMSLIKIPMVPAELVNTSSLISLITGLWVVLPLLTGLVYALAGLVHALLGKIYTPLLNMLVGKAPEAVRSPTYVWFSALLIALVPTALTGSFDVVTFFVSQFIGLFFLIVSFFVIGIFERTPKVA